MALDSEAWVLRVKFNSDEWFQERTRSTVLIRGKNVLILQSHIFLRDPKGVVKVDFNNNIGADSQYHSSILVTFFIKKRAYNFLTNQSRDSTDKRGRLILSNCLWHYRPFYNRFFTKRTTVKILFESLKIIFSRDIGCQLVVR